MLLVAYLYFILWFPMLRAQTPADFSSRSLDSLLQDYAFRALARRPRTGVPFDGNLPSNFTGIKVAALRLRSGSLRRKGVSNFKEFHLPIGIFEQPYVERLVLVYQDLGNWSSLYYPLPGYTYLAPILGLLAYDATNLSATKLQELDIRASQDPIFIDFLNVQQSPNGISPKCIYFGLDGSVEFDKVINQSVCVSTKEGHFSIVVEFAAAPSPAPVPAYPLGPAPAGERGKKGKDKRKIGVAIGSVVGGVLLLVLLGVVVCCIVKCRRRKMFRRMETAAERGEPLVMANVGYSRAPVAMETRTRPSLENDYLP